MSTILDNNAVTLKKPWKTLMNLTTEIQITKFHPSSQLLAIATNASFNGLRLVHIPSGRVYSNWPNSQIPIGNVKSLDFNHDGSMMMIGTGYGKVKLFALKHFRK